MNRGDFERRVNQSAAPHLKESGSLDEAKRLVLRESKALSESLVRETIVLAGKLHERYVQEKQKADEYNDYSEESVDEFSLAPTPTDYLAGEILLEKLAPWSEALREECFGHSVPPHGTVAKAANWIERTSEADLAGWRDKGTERNEALEKIEKLAREHLIELDLKATLLPYHKPDTKHVKNVPTVPRTCLYRLALETKRVAKRTGLAQDALVVHVLTGMRPAVPRVRVGEPQHMLALPNGEQLFARWATVTYFARDLTFEEHRQAYNMVREHVGGKGTEGIGYRDLTFWWLMNEMEAPPQKGDKTRFWQEGLRRWKQLYPDVKPDRWEGVRRKYLGLCDRMERWGML